MNPLKTIRSTSARCFRSCPRLYRYQFVDGYRPAETPETLSFGLAWHSAMEAHHSGQPLPALADMDPYQHAKLMALLVGYLERWDNERFDSVAVEAPYDIPLVNPQTGRVSQTWRHTGRIDGIARDKAGKLVLVEHKTTSEDIGAGSPYWAKLRLDQQLSNYFAGAKALGYDIAYCVYDVVRKPALRPLMATPEDKRKWTKDGVLYANQRLVDETAEEYYVRCLEELAANPDKYYARADVVRLEGEEDEAAFDLWQTAKMIHECERAGRWPRNPEACNHWGRECSFFGVCTGQESLESGVFVR